MTKNKTLPDIEKTIQKLEKLLQELESGELSLNDSLKKYEEGVKLSETCKAILEEAEQKIETLSGSSSET
ncbi:MAG: exodeoxyribonuclease VII small subunit [Fidelibacterota bacterium]